MSLFRYHKKEMCVFPLLETKRDRSMLSYRGTPLDEEREQPSKVDYKKFTNMKTCFLIYNFYYLVKAITHKHWLRFKIAAQLNE